MAPRRKILERPIEETVGTCVRCLSSARNKGFGRFRLDEAGATETSAIQACLPHNYGYVGIMRPNEKATKH